MAECIFDDDGERQIACTVAFQGEELVIEISFIAICVPSASIDCLLVNCGYSMFLI